ncbi:MAG: hypothetical protein VKJ44_00445 [Synechococcus sp.]|nr:hypothetical protein [Synechococcus sp.]
MPNYDAGHYFLSSLIPIQATPPAQDPGEQGPLQEILAQKSPPQKVELQKRQSEQGISHLQALREILAILPRENAALDPGRSGRDAATSAIDEAAAPFSRDLHTHFCRLVVIDDLTFVGRQHQDPILTLYRQNPVIPRPVDHLPCAFLALIVEFDAPDGSRQSLRNYLHGLWQVMAEELTEIFQHCVGFDPELPAESFQRQVLAGQLETTLSFHDYYWQDEHRLPNQWPRVLRPPLIVAAIGLSLLFWLGPAGGLRWLLLGLSLPALLFWCYRRILKVGMEPFPAAPRSDLRSVLKGLYLQRKFIDFMIANQGVSAETLQAEFLQFIDNHRPHSLSAPTQAPGSIPI